MSRNFELDNLHSILEDLNILLLEKDFSQNEYEEKIKENFKKYSFRIYRGLSKQACDILLTYSETKEDALYTISELKKCIMPRAYQAC